MSDVSTWSTTAGSNNLASPNGFPENMAPSGVNDSCREVMAATKRFYDTLGTASTKAVGVAAGNVQQVDQAVTAWTRGATTTIGTTLNGTLSDTSTTITAFNGVAGATYHCRALGAGSITHHGTNLIITQTGASITTAADDTFDVEMITGSTCRIKNYQLASGAALVASNASIQGNFKKLAISTTGTNATVTCSADEISVENSSNLYKTLRTVSLAINSAGSGANGLDTGSLATSTWYSVWVISKDDNTTAGLISTSETAPTMPSGYTYKARIGWVKTDGTVNKYPLRIRQYGRKVTYSPAAGGNLTSLPQMASGVAGDISAPTWVSVATGNFIPPTAYHITLLLVTGGNTSCLAAPNNNYGNYISNTNPPPLGAFGNSGATDLTSGVMTIESSNIYWASNGSSCSLNIIGWEDNI